MTGRMGGGRLIAVPRIYHGLGNRIRLVLSAQQYAAAIGREFAYVWPTGRAFGARLDELWEIDAPRMSLLRSRVLSSRHPYRDASLSWVDDARFDGVWQIRSSQSLDVPGDRRAWQRTLRELRPVPRVAARITQVFDERLRGEPYFGVMARTHAISHEITLRDSPMQWYLDRMSDLRRHVPGAKFYICADTPEAEKRLVEAFPGSFGLGDKGPYNSRSALQASVVDLYLLASSTHLIGAHYSSFPELAKYLGGSNLRLETSQSAAEAAFDPASPRQTVADPTRPWHRSAQKQ